MTNDTTHDPSAIERDIRQTQENMSRTVDEIGNQLSPRNVLNSLLDQAESHNIDGRMLLDGARRNPLALAMLAGGAIWLISDSDAKLPSFASQSAAKPEEKDGNHRDYLAHMERVEHREGEDQDAYQRRRDIARSNYFMMERGHQEDDAGFRQRLDDVADKFRAGRHALAEQGQGALKAVSETGSAAMVKTRDLYNGQPLVGGLIASAIGALFGSLLPVTQIEEDHLSDLGSKARELAGEQTDKLVDGLRARKDDVIAGIEEQLRPQPDPQQPQELAARPEPAMS